MSSRLIDFFVDYAAINAFALSLSTSYVFLRVDERVAAAMCVLALPAVLASISASLYVESRSAPPRGVSTKPYGIGQ
jgi:hypothetical protein